MSAAICSSETRAGTRNSQEEAVIGGGVDALAIVKDEQDPVDFLLFNPKYHDCFFTVDNPENDRVEKIGVASLYLIANSPVFREMFDSCKHTDLPDSQTHITDVSPVTFKLMLRFLYGGELPNMTAIETAGLALCGDKYKISRLVKEALKRLSPTNAEDVFPALICVTYASFPDLEVQVSKIIQQETEQVVQNPDFLKLSEECVLYILKQNTMNISELELWNNIFSWAKYQAENSPAKTVRDCLEKILGYVRFLTFDSDDILDYVLHTEALTPEEFVDLAIAVTKEQPLKLSVLCNIQENRTLYRAKSVRKVALDKVENKTKDEISTTLNHPETPKFDKICVFKASDYFDVEVDTDRSYSSIEIIPAEPVEIESFTCRSQNGQQNGNYKYICDIDIIKNENGFRWEQVIRVTGSAYYNDYVVLPLKFKSGKPIVMNPNEIWTFRLDWGCSSYPKHRLSAPDDTWGSVDVTRTTIKEENIAVIYRDSFHVLHVAYKKQ